MGDKPVTAVLGLQRRAPQGLAVTHQLVKTLAPTWDLADHPGQQHLAECLQVGFVEQIEEGGIRWPALEVKAKGIVQGFTVAFGKGLQITGALAAAEVASTVTSSRNHCG